MTEVVSGIAVFVKASGELRYLAPAGAVPTDAAVGWVALPTGFSEATFSWNASTRTMVEDAAKVEAPLVAAAKAEAERRKMMVRSPGSGKGAEYRIKRDEASASANVVAALLNALSKPAALQQYPAAATEAALTGETLSTVLTRYRTRYVASDAEVVRLAAIEQAAVTAIKAATTAAAKRAAHAAINWAWQPA